MEFSGVIKKKKKSWEISRDLAFKVLKFLKCATQFCGVSRGQALSGIFRGKVKTLKIPVEFSKMFSTILGIWDEKSIEKTFWSGADVPLPEEMIKSRK